VASPGPLAAEHRQVVAAVEAAVAFDGLAPVLEVANDAGFPRRECVTLGWQRMKGSVQRQADAAAAAIAVQETEAKLSAILRRVCMCVSLLLASSLACLLRLTCV